MKDSIAILWDIENVTPSSNSMFVAGLLEWANEIGRISVARAYGDWTKRELKGISQVLAQNSFEMMHVPMSRKDSADITLITNTIEIMYQYPHIKKIILVTGDADFRPLLQAMRKHGIETIIICDAKSASEDLLLLADAYKDYRELIPAGGEDTDEDDEDEEDLPRNQNRSRRNDNRSSEAREIRRGHKAMTFEESITLLKEALSIMQRQNKNTSIGAVKIRMKLLNGNFNERDLKFKAWKDYVVAAAKADSSIEVSYNDNDVTVNLKTAPVKTGTNQGNNAVGITTNAGSGIVIPEIIRQLVMAVRNCQSASSQDGWVPYSMVSQYLIDIGVDIREHNYGRIRTLIEAAEKRSLVETRSESQHWLVRITNEGSAYC